MSIPDALHAPTTITSPAPAPAPAVAAASSAAADSSSRSIQAEVNRLTERKHGIQAQLDAYFDVLESVSPTHPGPPAPPLSY